jgi:hypothetical protein
MHVPFTVSVRLADSTAPIPEIDASATWRCGIVFPQVLCGKMM